MQAGGASERDQDPILPRFETTRERSGDECRVLEFHVSPTAGGPTRSLLRELQSGDEPGGSEADPPGDASVVASPTAPRQGPDGPGAHVQSRHPWLDWVVRQLPQVRALSCLPTPQPHPELVGHAEVQAVQGASPAGGALAGPDRSAAADTVRPPAAPRGEANGWLIEAVEPRGSRTVLGGRGGETPPRHSLDPVWGAAAAPRPRRGRGTLPRGAQPSGARQ
jgi:hypothetical protein